MSSFYSLNTVLVGWLVIQLVCSARTLPVAQESALTGSKCSMLCMALCTFDIGLCRRHRTGHTQLSSTCICPLAYWRCSLLLLITTFLMNNIKSPFWKYCLTLSSEGDSCEFGSRKYLLLCGFGGIISCGTTHAALVPLDLVKCRMQVCLSLWPGAT